MSEHDTTPPTSEPVAGLVERTVRPRADVARVMAAVWDLVRSGPNFDGRQRDVEIVVAAEIAAAVAAERERICHALPGGNTVDPQWVADMVRGLRA